MAYTVDYAVRVWRGAGDGTFRPAAALRGEDLSGRIVAGDFNGDGKPDLVAGFSPDADHVLFFQNTAP